MNGGYSTTKNTPIGKKIWNTHKENIGTEEVLERTF
jgi:hypothetical protein